MQDIVIPKPYQFVPPDHRTFWLRPLGWWLPGRVRRTWGVRWPEFRGLERFQASLKAGHGILVAPNHCRPCDPEVIGLLCIKAHVPPYVMAVGTPAVPHSVNSEGLKRRGFTPEQIRNIKNAFRVLYRSDLLLKDAVAELQSRVPTQPELKIFVDFIGESTRSLVR